jgi:hypothetical protein
VSARVMLRLVQHAIAPSVPTQASGDQEKYQERRTSHRLPSGRARLLLQRPFATEPSAKEKIMKGGTRYMPGTTTFGSAHGECMRIACIVRVVRADSRLHGCEL